LSANHSHDYFVELCALSTSGVLNAEEWKELSEHLSHCSACTRLKEQYEQTVVGTLSRLAPELEEDDQGHTLPSWSQDEAEASLMAALDRKDIGGPSSSPSPRVSQPWLGRWVYAAAALFLVASVSIGYRLAVRQRRTSMAATAAPLPSKKAMPTLGQGSGEVTLPSQSRTPDTAKITGLQRQLQMNLQELTRLKQQNDKLEVELAERNADLKRNARDRAEVDRQLTASQSNIDSLRQQLSSIANQKSQAGVESQALQAQVRELNASLQAKDQEVARNDELLQHDRDIRNLIGARDLYIAEIYDVAKTGATQKPFGRVFYTKGKSLVFYAYDLDQQPGVKLANTFQAWGRRGVDPQHDVNLGIFYQDDQNKQRWILKSDDPATLAQIDAVFVTVEPNGKSSKPSGKPLLFTYLHMTPNHP
jgi:hypothetical protein